ncbi:hypothetical protein [Tardiphaga sp.]|uniref:hypothetical protein n=1 Tax=Tardiphaga sp. TaxID=1926292 RepID=UPI0025FFB224|nr:hypothetical protein [Tardiphaga sp.]
MLLPLQSVLPVTAYGPDWQRRPVNDAPGHLIQQQLRHKKFDTTSGYIQSAVLHKRNAADMAGP